MANDVAVVLDVAGTMLKMYRVAKNIPQNVITTNVVTTHLVMEKSERALVVPHVDPDELMDSPPEITLGTFFESREEYVNISCSSTPVSEDEVCSILLGSKARVKDLQDTITKVCAQCPRFYYTSGVIVDVDIREVTYSISTGGRPFPSLQNVLEKLKAMGADIYVASGDSMRSLSGLTKCKGIEPDHIYPASTPRQKEQVVLSLKEEYDTVVMMGDGLNDIYALKAADLGILTVQQDSQPSENLFQAADEVIKDITNLPEILKGIVKGGS